MYYIKLLLCVTLCFLFCRSNAYGPLSHIKPSASEGIQQNAVVKLIERIIQGRVSDFVLVVDTRFENDGKEKFSIEKLGNGKIQIKGTSGVAVATGFNYYLKYYCNCHISWESHQINLPNNLPATNITINFNDRFRYYQNVCTTSYSFVWWNWPQWEQHIDWMALNSFNLVLAFNGQEAIWERVYKALNLSQEDVDEHMSGPAFLAWMRMGNMRGWGGPLSESWHSKSLTLQKKILNRMRELGIIPVLPAFAGHLPRAFKRLFPHVRMTKTDPWNDFDDRYCCPYFLDPTENLFNTIGTMFITEQIKEYGTDHVYNCDSFNENKPTSSNLTYLSDVGRSIYKAMADVDPDAIWIMQNWLFVHDQLFWTKERAKALLTSVPVGKMLVLDLQSELSPKYDFFDQYFGQPYIWCMLHNFGGTLGMFGSSDIINEIPIQARNANNSTMVGIGLTPEGINQNYVIYELMMENTWRTESTNLSNWFELYSNRRYGKIDVNAIHTWQLLQRSVYNFKGSFRNHGRYVIIMKPTLRLTERIWYNTNDVIQAWDSLLQASDQLKDNEGYLHDLADLTRQVLQNHGAEYYRQMIKYYRAKSYTYFIETATILLEVQTDMEEILASNKNFLLGNWIDSAKKCASSSKEEELFEYNARNQITLWGPNGEIRDYAIKQWSGILSNYTIPRWSIFVKHLTESLLEVIPFNQSVVNDIMFYTVEQPFTKDRSIFPSQPTGDTVKIAEKIHKRSWIIRNWTRIDERRRRRMNRRNRERVLYHPEEFTT